MVLTVGRCWFRIAEMGAQVCYGVYLWQYIRLAHLTASLPEKTKNEIVSSTAEKRSWQTGYIAYDLWRKNSKHGGYSGEHPTKFLWKTIEKNIKFDSFLYAFWERGDDELLHVQRRMHPEAPESSRKAERLRIKPGDSNIKVIYWFKMNLQQYVKTFFT